MCVGVGALQERFDNMIRTTRHAMAKKVADLVVEMIPRCPVLKTRNLLQVSLNKCIFLPSMIL